MTIRTRVATVVGIGAVALLGVTAAVAQPLHSHARPEPGDVTGDAQGARPASEATAQRGAVPRKDEQARRQAERRVKYREYLGQAPRVAQERAAALQRQNRVAQQRAHALYAQRLREQQLLVERLGRFAYDGTAGQAMPANYRYARGGRYYDTDEQGIESLRHAMSCGYEEGRRAGEADRLDRWRGGYEASYPYQDASYGYDGLHVDHDEYTYYFREGFQRGYDDGYRARSQYGRLAGGRGTVFAAVIANILTVVVTR